MIDNNEFIDDQNEELTHKERRERFEAWGRKFTSPKPAHKEELPEDDFSSWEDILSLGEPQREFYTADAVRDVIQIYKGLKLFSDQHAMQRSVYEHFGSSGLLNSDIRKMLAAFIFALTDIGEDDPSGLNVGIILRSYKDLWEDISNNDSDLYRQYGVLRTQGSADIWHELFGSSARKMVSTAPAPEHYEDHPTAPPEELSEDATEYAEGDDYDYDKWPGEDVEVTISKIRAVVPRRIHADSDDCPQDEDAPYNFYDDKAVKALEKHKKFLYGKSLDELKALAGEEIPETANSRARSLAIGFALVDCGLAPKFMDAFNYECCPEDAGLLDLYFIFKKYAGHECAVKKWDSLFREGDAFNLPLALSIIQQEYNQAGGTTVKSGLDLSLWQQIGCSHFCQHGRGSELHRVRARSDSEYKRIYATESKKVGRTKGYSQDDAKSRSMTVKAYVLAEGSTKKAKDILKMMTGKNYHASNISRTLLNVGVRTGKKSTHEN